MLSKNNILDRDYSVRNRFSIRKLTIGAASVLIGTTLWISGKNADIVHADVKDSNGSENPEVQSSDYQATTEPERVVVNTGQLNSQNTENETAILENKATSSAQATENTESKSGRTDQGSANENSTASVDQNNRETGTQSQSQSTNSSNNDTSHSQTKPATTGNEEKLGDNTSTADASKTSDTNSKEEQTKNNKIYDLSNMTNEGPIDRSSWKDIKVYEQTSIDNSTPVLTPAITIADIHLERNTDGSIKPINLSVAEKNFEERNSDSVEVAISNGDIKSTKDIIYWFSDENGNKLDPNKVDPNKLPTPYVLFGSSFGMSAFKEEDDNKYAWKNGKYYIQDFNDYVKKHPFIVKDGKGDFEYNVGGMSDSLIWTTRMPHDVAEHLPEGMGYSEVDISSSSTIPNKEKPSEEYIKSLYTLGSLDYKTPNNLNDPFTDEVGKEQKLYVLFPLSDSAAPTINSYKEDGTPDVSQLDKIKNIINQFPKNPTSDQLDNLHNDITDSGLEVIKQSQFSTSNYIKNNSNIRVMDNGCYATLIPEYDKDGRKLDKYAGRIWAMRIGSTDKDNNYIYTIKLHYEALDPNYTGYLGNLYGYTGGGSGGASKGTYILPIVNKTAGQATLKFYDQTTNTWLSDTDSSEGAPNDDITFSKGGNELQNYLDKGYGFVSIDKQLSEDTTQVLTNKVEDVWKNLGNFTSDKDQQFVINLVHTATPQTATKTATRTIHYVLDDGSGIPDSQKPTMKDENGVKIPDVVDFVEWTGTQYIDNVTKTLVNNAKEVGNTWIVDNSVVSTPKWTTQNGDVFEERKSPQVTGYTETPETVPEETAKLPANAQSNEDVYVIYKSVPQKATLKFWDDTTNSAILDIADINAQGNYNTNINFNGKDDRYNVAIDKGYEYVGVTDEKGNPLTGETFDNVSFGTFDNIKDNDQTFTVHFKHGTTPVDPDHPSYGYDKEDLNKTITREVFYQYADGSQADTPVKQSVSFRGQGIVDKVTGQLVTIDKDGNINGNGQITWTPKTGQFDTTKSIDTTQYHITSINEQKTNVIVDQQTGVVSGETVTPTTSNSKIIITLAKNPTPEVKDQVAQVIYRDHDEGDRVIAQTNDIVGKSDTDINYSSANTIKTLEDKGYVLIDNSYDPDSKAPKFDNDEKQKQVFYIDFKHGIRPVTPDNPADPNKPVDPTKPNTPTPSNSNLSKEDLDKTITRTIEYKYADGTTAHKSVVQSVEFKGQGILDTVTGNLVNLNSDGSIKDQRGSINWNAENQSYVDVPAINHEGYYVSNVSGENSKATINDTAVSGETVTPNSPNGHIVITLAKNPEVPVVANGSIRYIDDTANTTLANGSFSGQVGNKIPYTTADKIASYEKQGYKLVSNNFNDGTQEFDKDTAKNIFEVHLAHDTIPVDPDHPGYGYDKTNLNKTITREVVYQYADGSQADTPVKQSVSFHGQGIVDKVTGQLVTVKDGKISGKGQIIWTPEDGKFETTKSIDTDEYEIIRISESNTSVSVDKTNGAVSEEPVTPNNHNSKVVITLAKKQVPVEMTDGSITYVDDVNGQTLQSATFGGQVGSKINYTTADKIASYEKQGYKLVSNDFSDNSQIYNKDAKKNIFTVHLTHTTSPVDPDHPGYGYGKNDLDKTITRTVEYVYSDGSKTLDPVTQQVHFEGHGIVDNVTGGFVTIQDGKIIPGGSMNWTVTPGDSSYVAVPAIDTTGYYISGVTKNNTNANVDVKTGAVTGEKIDHNSSDSHIVITLTKTPKIPVVANGSIKYIDDTANTTLANGSFLGQIGDKIPYTTADKISSYEKQGYRLVSNNFNDGTQVFDKDTAKNTFEVHLVHDTIPVDPDHPGYGYDKTNLNKTITRDVTYIMADGSKAPAPVHQEVHFTGKGIIDKVTGQLVTVDKDGKIAGNGQITWTPENGDSFLATNPVANNGYKVISITGDVNGKADHNTGAVASDKVTPTSDNQSITIVLNKGNQTPVVTAKTGTQIVHYVDEKGNSIASDTTNDSHTFIQVNGKWTENGYQYKGGNVPIIPGYVAITKTFDGQKVTPDNPNAEVTIAYKKIGTIIPVDKDGHEIPGQQHPQFNNDPNDPTKVIDGKKPTVPGYKPETGHEDDPVHPDVDPSKDVKVPYVKDNNLIQTTGNVAYIDDTTGQTLRNDSFSGNVGDKISYTTQDKIDEYLNQGYKLESNSFKDGNEFFQNEGNQFAVRLIHDTVPVKPGDKNKPGDPINDPKKDPAGPKYPNGVSQNDLTATTSRTVIYQDENGNAVNGSPDGKSSYVQTAHFGRTAIVDKVTGEILGYDTNNDGKVDTKDGNAAWQSMDSSFDAVPSKKPSQVGYDYVDKSSVGETTVNANDKDSVVYVTYGKAAAPNATPSPEPTVPPTSPTNPAPSKPTEPVEPSTPEVPEIPEAPELPKAPEHHNAPKRTSENFVPHAQDSNSRTSMPNSETVSPNGEIVDANGHVVGYIDENGQAHYGLPQTGENDNEDVAALIAGGAAVAMGLIGLAGVKKRRQN